MGASLRDAHYPPHEHVAISCAKKMGRGTTTGRDSAPCGRGGRTSHRKPEATAALPRHPFLESDNFLRADVSLHLDKLYGRWLLSGSLPDTTRQTAEGS